MTRKRPRTYTPRNVKIGRLAISYYPESFWAQFAFKRSKYGWTLDLGRFGVMRARKAIK